jgi:hypothetical protein
VIISIQVHVITPRRFIRGYTVPSLFQDQVISFGQGLDFDNHGANQAESVSVILIKIDTIHSLTREVYMGYETRSTTKGNKRVDYTKIRQDLKNVSPAIAATLRNAVPKNGHTATTDEVKGQTTVNPYKLERLSSVISNNINAVSDLRAITPYIDKAELIWNTILLYPNGKQDKVLTYDTQNTKLKNAALHSELLAVWDNYFTNDYKIEAELGKMINDILWNTGSYVLFNLSRPGLDYLINGSAVDPSNPDSRTGNETFRLQAKQHLESEFVKVDNRQLARNKGFFVRDPHAKDTKAQVGGLEAILGDRPAYSGTEFSLFSKEEDPDGRCNITLTDNPAILYLQKFNEAVRDSDINSVMGVESFDNVIMSAMQVSEKKKKAQEAKGPEAKTQNLTEDELDKINQEIFKARDIRQQTMQFVKPIDTLSVAPYGRGLSWHIPSEAVIPIHHNGSSRDIDDYIVLLDDQGNFLKSTSDPEFYQSVKKTTGAISNKNQNGSENSMISSLRAIQDGSPCDFDMSEFVDVSKSNLIRRFISSVVSGKGDSVSITIDEETNKIFLSRLWRRQGVRCLYVPGEAISYGALKLGPLGTGQSLTQSAKMHIARLAAYDLADALANLEAAQPHTEMTINVEKEDADPEQTIAIARATFFDSNPRLHNLLSTAQLSVPQIVDAMRESSLSVKVNAGDNPHLPTPDISTQGKQKDNFHSVDQASRDAVLNSIANYFNLPRAWLDVSDDQNNFQIEAITEHQMVFNQAVNWQNELSKFVIDFERKHARVNAPLMTQLVNVILENKKLWIPDSKEVIEGSDEQKIKLLLADFFNSIYCSFPQPTSTETTNKLVESLEAVDKLVKSWEELSGTGVVMAQMVKLLGIEAESFTDDELKAMITSVLKMEAFRRFNLPMPFDEIVNEGKGGGIASLVHHIVAQRNNVADFVAKLILERSDADKKLLKEYKSKIDKKLQQNQPEEPEDGGFGDGDDGEGGEPADDGLGDDGGVPGDDAPPADDETGDDTPPDEGEEEPPTEDAGEEGEEGGDAPKGSDNPEDPNYNPFTKN